MVIITPRGDVVVDDRKEQSIAFGEKLMAQESTEQWARKAGLDYQVTRMIVSYKDIVGQVRTYPGQNVAMRVDNGAALGIVSDRYEFHQPLEILDAMRVELKQADYQIERAGCFGGGSKVYVLAKHIGETAEIVAGDDVAPYILGITSFDRSSATKFCHLMMRRSCKNGLAGYGRNGASEISIRHSTKLPDKTTIQKALGLADCGWEQFIERMKKLPLIAIPSADTEALVHNILSPRALDKPRSATETILSNFAGHGDGALLDGSPGTAWGLLNAITQYVDHQRQPRNGQSRSESAFLAVGKEIKLRAAKTLEAMA